MTIGLEAGATAGRHRSVISILAPICRIAAILGVALLLLNIVGTFLTLRAPDIDSYADFARPTTLTFDAAMAGLSRLNSTDKRLLVTEATRIFHEGMAHVTVADIEKNGLEHYRMRVPAWENYLLYALSYLKPDTYRDYEFCSYQKALERGTGRCGQQSLALVSYLSSRDIPTGFIALGGHAIATAKVSENDWYMLDPDYGGVIPYDIKQAEANPENVTKYYWGKAAAERKLHRLFDPENNLVRYGGPEVRYRRACPIEKAAYVLKWAIPIVLIVPFLILTAVSYRGRKGLSP